MAALIQSLAISGSRKADGSPNAGGRIFLTDPTAGTAVSGYTDRDASAAITLDGGGILLDGSGRRKIYIQNSCTVGEYDADGTLVASYQAGSDVSATNVEVLVNGYAGIGTDGLFATGRRTWLSAVLASMAASCGGDDGLVKIAAAATGRNIYTKFAEVQVSVKDFGAVGNGITDDTAAIQAAINYVASLGGGVVYFPPGVYLTSSAILVSTSMVFRGASAQFAATPTSKILATNVTQHGITNSVPITIEGLGVAHSSASTGSAVSNSSIVRMVSSTVGLGFTNGVAGSGSIYAYDSNIAGSAIGAGTTGSSAVIFLSDVACSSAGIGISSINATGKLTVIGGTSTAITTSAYMTTLVGVTEVPTTTITVNAAATSFYSYGTNWSSITDNRVGAPVFYTFNGAGSFTPLPLQTDTIRVTATAAATITINNPAAVGIGRKWTLSCIRTTAGAVTWTFDTKFVLSAAVAPANGNRVQLLLEYMPQDDKWYEVGRAATAN
jgi:Pectate lyase superfamily protein